MVDACQKGGEINSMTGGGGLGTSCLNHYPHRMLTGASGAVGEGILRKLAITTLVRLFPL